MKHFIIDNFYYLYYYFPFIFSTLTSFLTLTFLMDGIRFSDLKLIRILQKILFSILLIFIILLFIEILVLYIYEPDLNTILNDNIFTYNLMGETNNNNMNIGKRYTLVGIQPFRSSI